LKVSVIVFQIIRDPEIFHIRKYLGGENDKEIGQSKDNWKWSGNPWMRVNKRKSNLV
jgi:hypothetical protein